MDGNVVPLPQDVDLRLGRVVSISGSHVIAMIRRDLRAEVGSVQIGSLVKIPTRSSLVYGIVSGLNIPVPDDELTSTEAKLIELELVGESTSEKMGQWSPFQRGVSLFPSLGDTVIKASTADLNRVYGAPEKPTIVIGSIYQDERLPAFVLSNELLGKHFAVLGTTGSGKSCAVTVLLREVLKQNPNSHIMLLDVHNEYAAAFGDVAELLSPSQGLKLPYWLFNFEEMVEVLVTGEGEVRATQIAILSETIPAAKQQFGVKAEEVRSVTVDTPIPYRISDLVRLIEQPLTSLNKPENFEPYLRLVARLKNLSADSRFSFMFEGLSVRDNLAEIISRLFRIPVDGKPVTVVDLSGVPSEIINVVVSVLCRLSFDFAVWSERKCPLLLVCEEAHRYVPQDRTLGFEPTKRALSRIAKEGRKYGVGLCVVSQRPAELASGLLSQCNTIFAMRLTTQKDQEFVRGAMSDSALGLLKFLPSLRTGEAIAVGDGVTVPVRLRFSELPEAFRPNSGTAQFTRLWQEEPVDTDLVRATIQRWRRRM